MMLQSKFKHCEENKKKDTTIQSAKDQNIMKAVKTQNTTKFGQIKSRKSAKSEKT